MKYLVFIYIFCSTLSIYGQEMGGQRIDSDEVLPWHASMIQEYDGSYFFGSSESETDLLIFTNGDQTYAQLKEGSWSEDNENLAWVFSYRNFTNVRIQGNQFYSDQSNGTFVQVVIGGKRIPGLRVSTPWSPLNTEETEEIGPRQTNPKAVLFEGRFPYGSQQILTKEAIKDLSAEDLRIMRNEIFARYGHAFRQGGEMAAYFAEQSWYRRQEVDATPFLTELEKKNIALIQSVEAVKKTE